MERMEKQTAVEFLEKICNDRGYHLLSEYFKQAKAMEKEQCLKMLPYDLDELFNEIDESIDYHEFDFTSFRLGFQKALELLTFKSE